MIPIMTIHGLLDNSVAAWNRGDLDAFMHSYEDSPDTEYVNSKSVIRGYASIRARYAKAYGAGMGTLALSDVYVRPLGPDYAVVTARWHLALPHGKNPTGLFTLVMHKSSAGWGIVTDHSP